MNLLTRLAEPIRNYRANRILGTIDFFIGSDESILSVGDGDGYVSLRIQEKTGAKIQGLDILSYHEYRVKGIPLILYDGKKIPFPDNSFDIVAAIFVLHHCDDLELTLQEMVRVAKKKLIIIEDVFNNSLDLNFLRFFDYIENRTFSAEMPLPFNFHHVNQWKQIFTNHSLKLFSSRQFRALPLPIRNQSFCLLKK